MQLPGGRIPFDLFISSLERGAVPNRDYRDCPEGPYQDRTTRQDRASWEEAMVGATAAGKGGEATGETTDRERAVAAVYPSIWDRTGFVVAVVVVPCPGAPGAGENYRGVGSNFVRTYGHTNTTTVT